MRVVGVELEPPVLLGSVWRYARKGYLCYVVLTPCGPAKCCVMISETPTSRLVHNRLRRPPIEFRRGPLAVFVNGALNVVNQFIDSSAPAVKQEPQGVPLCSNKTRGDTQHAPILGGFHCSLLRFSPGGG